MDTFAINLSASQWVFHGLWLAVNLAFFFSVERIVSATQASIDQGYRVQVGRMVSGIICILILLDIVVLNLIPELSTYVMRLAYSFMAVYGGLLLFQLASHYSLKRFGRKKSLDDSELYVETYSSRLMNIVLAVMIAVVTLYVLIKIWGADSLLETTGIFGIVFAFLAFTSGQWAPDVLSGLVMLNSQTLEDGDLIKVEGYKDEFVIRRITFIYTVLFDIHNNNRTLLRNSRLLNGKIDNLSRIASSDGIRRALKYNIGYPDATSLNRETRVAVMDAQIKNVDDMFGGANKLALEDNRACINESKPFEWAMTSAGDDALEYTLWVYLERIPSTKVTATMRKHYAGTINRVNELVYRCSVIEGLQLATPKLAQIALQADSVQDVSEFGSRAKPQEQSDKR